MRKTLVIAGCISVCIAAAQPRLKEEMHERFTRATMAQTAIINGQLADAQHWGRRLAAIAPKTDDFGDIRSLFGHFATELAESDSIPDAALATGRMANACGTCHELFGVMAYRFESSAPEPGGDSLAARMARHIWAADRLWEGLVGRAEGSWTSGASVLTEAPLGADQLPGASPQVEKLARQVNALGREAVQTVQWDARARLYGKLLGTCAECHSTYRDVKR